MKMTMHIDEALLARVMAATGNPSKTAAVEFALKELDRRTELKRLASEGLGLSADELREAFDPASASASEPRPANKSASYARRPGPRR
jgi:Arc/MetJ family transcription regulator